MFAAVGIQHAMYMLHIAFYGPYGSTKFFHIIPFRHEFFFLKKLLNMKQVLIFLQLL
jgi:hypothetical protein